MNINNFENNMPSKILYRGKEYFEDGLVENLEYMDDGSWFANVQGTELYEVVIDIDNMEVTGYQCDCPYDGSICKHVVATMFAIREELNLQQKPNISLTCKKENKVDTTANFELDKIEDFVKLRFLKELFERNHEIRNQFIEYAHHSRQACSADAEDVWKLIAEFSNEIKDDLESLDFEIDWEDYTPRHSGYIPEYEAYEHNAEDLIDALIDPIKSDIEHTLKNGETLCAIAKIIGSYNAFNKARINNEYESLGDNPNFYLLEKHSEMLKEITEELNKTVLPLNILNDILNVFFEFYFKNYKGKTVYLGHFESFLINLTGNKETADYALTLINKFEIEPSACPDLTIHLHSFSGKNEQWCGNAESLCESIAHVAKQLLEYYLEKNDRNNFIRIARKTAIKFKIDIRDYILKNIDKTVDVEFYKSLLAQKSIEQANISAYTELRVHLSEDEKNKFIEKIQYPETYKMQVLETEGKYDEILAYLRKNQQSYHFIEIIGMISVHYPVECFELIKIKITNLLITAHERHVYSEMARILKIARSLKGMNEQSTKLIADTYNHKPNKPAFRDEMRRDAVLPD